jgi:uncharacterized protein YdeI (YjbR/CyaY-like superfamily)
LQWRFNSEGGVQKDSKLIREYVEEAISNQKQGKKIRPERVKKSVISAELNSALKKDLLLSEKFNALSKAKQNEYAEYINEAKRDETKRKRIDKIIPMVKQGSGLNDKYKK